MERLRTEQYAMKHHHLNRAIVMSALLAILAAIGYAAPLGTGIG
jgi:hypothetical protein